MGQRDAECIVVGGGIGGAVLALALAKKGRRVAILEKETAPPKIARPEILANATLAAFDSLGVGRRMRAEAVLPLKGLIARAIGGRTLLSVSTQDFQDANVWPHSTNPMRTREILLEEASKTHLITVVRGIEVTALIREKEAVVGVAGRQAGAETAYRARVVVGDDGGHSRIRQALNIPLTTQPFVLDFLAVKHPVPGDNAGVGQAWLNPAGLRGGLTGAVIMPLPGGCSAAVFLISESAYKKFQNQPQSFTEAVAALLPQSQAIFNQNRFPGDFIHLRRPFGHAQSYAANGAALLGDAAHPVTPAGGQGANMSVADGMVLADVIDGALRQGDVSAGALQSYEAVRRPANQRSLEISIGTNRIIRIAALVPGLAGLLPLIIARQNNPKAKQRLLRAISQAFVSNATPEVRR